MSGSDSVKSSSSKKSKKENKQQQQSKSQQNNNENSSSDSNRNNNKSSGEQKLFTIPQEQDSNTISPLKQQTTPIKILGEFPTHTTETVHEELQFSKDLIQLAPKLVEKSSIQETGKWGEEFVLNYLKSNYPNSEIKWFNENGESGNFYDIELKHSSDDIEYIEVKTTLTDDKSFFEVSWRELQFAAEKESKFQIYRVYGAGKNSVRVVKVINPIVLSVKGKLQLMIAL
eukprot:c19183_g1_i2.p1 GENE.c19183_g1_i2~~c19183_g1_i2.p1  ORF type:complete len:244 (+),score=115.88 c19183_g1_i2:46-732(+)